MDTQKQDCSLGAPSAKRPKTQFRCSKCGFITDDSSQFQQHIPQHKSDENTRQCLRCGLCFKSVLSLNRHLYIVHKVKEEEEEIPEMEQDNQPVRPADTEPANDLLPERNEPESSQTEEPAILQRDQMTDCDFELSFQTQDVASL